MKNVSKTKKQLVAEVEELRKKNKKLEDKNAKSRQNMIVLKESEKKYRTLVENSRGMVFTVDLKGNFMFINEALERNLGYSREELRQINWFKLAHPEDLPRIKKQFSLLAKGQPVDNMEYRYKTKKGSYIHILNNAMPLFDSLGNMATVLISAYDICPLKKREDQPEESQTGMEKRAERSGSELMKIKDKLMRKTEALNCTVEALQESEEKYSNLFEHSNDAVFLCDLEGNMLDVNQKGLDLSGYTRPEILSIKVSDIHPQYELDKFKKGFEALSRNGFVKFECDFKKMNGDLFPSEISYSMFEISGKKVIQGIVRDITEDKQVKESLQTREAYLEQLFESAQEAIVMADNDVNVLRANEEFTRLFGYTQDEAVGQNLDDLVVPDNLLSGARSINKCVSKGKKVALETIRRRKNGTLIDVSVLASPIIINGKRVGSYGIYRDVSERNKAGRALQESEEKFRTLADKSPNMIFINKKGRVVYVNKKCEDVMGYTKNEFYSPDFNFFTLVSPDTVDTVESSYRNHKKGMDSPPYEYALITKKGERIEAIITTKLIEYEGDRAILGIITDITERKKGEKELSYRLEFEELILSISTHFIYLKPDEIDIGINQTLEKICNFTEADRSYVFILRDNGTKMDITHEWCAQGVKSKRGQLQGLDVQEFRWGISQLEKSKILNIPHVSEMPPEAASGRKVIQKEGTQSLVCSPILVGQALYGFLGLDSVRVQRIWSDDIVSMLRLTSEIFANALERKRAEEALENSSWEWRTTFDAISDGICMCDKEGSILRCNKSMKNLIKKPFSEIIGQSCNEIFFGTCVPDEDCLFARIRKTHKRESAVRRRNNRWFKVTLDPIIDEEDNFRGSVCVKTDITDQKQSEELILQQNEFLNNVLESLTHPFYVIDAKNYTITMANTAAHLGHLTEKTTCFKLTHRRTDPCKGRNHGCPIDVIKKTKKPVTVEHIHYDIDRNKKNLEIHGYPIFDENKNVIQIIEYSLDITKRKHAENALKKAYSELKEAQQELIQSEKLAALGSFASGIAHEIKNPLGIILGGVEFVEKKLKRKSSPIDENVEIAIEKIKESVFKADTFIRGLLQFARPSELKAERIKPDSIITDTLHLLKFRAPLNNIKINREYAKERLYIEADKNQMQQVFFNLLMNAVEAMPKGGEIWIKTYKPARAELASEKPVCIIKIEDSGAGIQKNTISKVFEPYFSTKGDKGTGLGLSIAKRIVDNHKGNLTIMSQPGEGTQVQIVLPLIEGNR